MKNTITDPHAITSATFDAHLKRIAAMISAPPIIGLASHKPEDWATPTQCFTNVDEKIRRSGGSHKVGWAFLRRVVADIPEPGYVIAFHHAVWHAPDGTLIDVTPFHHDPKHRPYGVDGSVLFLVDAKAQP